MPVQGYAPGEIARLGKERYDRDLRSLAEDQHRGRFLALDIETGEYAVDDSLLAACDALHERRPDAPTYVVRVGSAAVYRIGGRTLRPRP